jgi:DNA-binding PadR family transcriptional regulator
MRGPMEFMVLRAVEALGNSAYGASIWRYVALLSGRHEALTFGQICVVLKRLEGKGLISSSMDPPRAIPGGRSRRVYWLEDRGIEALADAQELYTRLVSLQAGVC